MLFKKQESYRKGIVVSTFLNIISKGIAFVNSILLVYLFGANFGTDTYFLVTSSVSFVASFLLGVVSYVVIPEAMRIRVNSGEKEGQSYINFFFWTFVIIGVVFVLIVFLSAPVFYSLFSKYSSAELSQYNTLLLLSAILFPLTFITNLLVFVMASYKYFTTPMIVSLINSCVSIILLFVFKSIFGVTAAIIAYAAGATINLVWLLFFMRRNLNWNFFHIRKPTRQNWQNILLMELNIIPISFRSFINIYLLSGLGAGIITSYNYGMQIALIPEMMIITQVTAVTGIKLNELSAQGNIAEINALFFRVMRILFFIMLPLGILIFLLSNEILQVLFLFKSKNDIGFIGVIAAFMACFAITLPTRALDGIISNIMTAQQKIRQGVFYAVFMHTAIILLTILAVHFYGLKGFYFVIPFVYLVFMPVFYYFFTRKVLPFIGLSMWLKQSAPYFLLITAAGTGLYFFKKHFLATESLFINITVVSVLLILSVLGINKLIKYQSYTFKVWQ